MSRVYFHSPSGAVELRGAERAYGASITDDLALSVLGLAGDLRFRSGDDPASRFLDAVRPPLEDWGRQNMTTLKAAIRYGSPEASVLLPDGRQVEVWSLLLNTVLTAGSDALRLLAFIHAQCEIHGWFAGANRNWLADIITTGRASNLLRSDMGWEGLVEFLRADQTEPVVMSYSVCEQFPNPTVAGWAGLNADDDEDARYDAWYDLPHEERWALCMPKIERMEITPERLRDPRYFGPQLNGFDVIALFSAVEAAR